METNSYDMYAYMDNSGDGKADKTGPVYQTRKMAFGKIEHQRSGERSCTHRFRHNLCIQSFQQMSDTKEPTSVKAGSNLNPNWPSCIASFPLPYRQLY